MSSYDSLCFLFYSETRAGKPPSKKKHGGTWRKYEELDEAAILAESVERWSPPTTLRDNDRQLMWLLSVLNTMHTEFFCQVGSV